MKLSTLITTYLVYPHLNHNQIQVIACALTNKLYIDQPVTPYALPDLIFEDQIKINEDVDGKIIKMGKKEHIESFFKDGTIQLGCFNYFSSFDHDEIGDKTEGSFILIGDTSSNTTFTEIAGGFNYAVFCTYSGEPNEDCINDFGYDSCLEIKDPVKFSEAIAKSIGTKNYEYARCVYSKHKIIVGSPPPGTSFDKISADLLNLANKAKYFVKPQRYSPQSEFRFIWPMESDLNEPIIVKCPEAIEYCSRLI